MGIYEANGHIIDKIWKIVKGIVWDGISGIQTGAPLEFLLWIAHSDCVSVNGGLVIPPHFSGLLSCASLLFSAF